MYFLRKCEKGVNSKLDFIIEIQITCLLLYFISIQFNPIQYVLKQKLYFNINKQLKIVFTIIPKEMLKYEKNIQKSRYWVSVTKLIY